MKEEGWLFTGDALVRSVLHVDTTELPDELWATQVRMAEWAQNNHLRKLGMLFSG